jgi:hypothetical protein
MAPTASEEQDFMLSSLAPSRAQKRLALAVVLVMLVAFFATTAFLSRIKVPRIVPFVPMYAATMFVNDSITAILLFAQFSILRSRALLAISGGYLFTALMLIPWMLTFPGVFTPGGLLGAGLQSTAWLYVIWHAGFPAFVVAYALLKRGDPDKRLRHGSVRGAIFATVALTAALVCAATVLVTAGHHLLPQQTLDTVHFTRVWFYAAGFISLLSIVALAVLWVRRRTVLDLCLIVVMCAFVIEICMISFPVAARFTVGWYAGRIFGAVSGSLVLLMLLYEITTLYARMLLAVTAQRRERDAADDRERDFGVDRTRSQPTAVGDDLHSALHDEVPRHGHGSLDLPLDHRGARRQAVGHAEEAPRRGVPVRLARRVRAPRRMR